jgi:hypothetical protein
MTYSSYDGSHSGFDAFVEESPLDQRLRVHHPPLMVMFGAEEQIVDDPREALSAYADIPNARTALIQGAGHSPNVEKPAETARLIINLATWVETRAKARARTARKVKRPAPEQLTVDCESNRLAGPGDPNWRQRSTVVGQFGLYGPGRDFNTVSRMGSAYATKIPAIVEGRRAVTLRVPRAEEGQVGLIYGPIRSVAAVGDAATRVTFEPCPDLARTVWPGGLALADRDPVRLEVVSRGSAKQIRIG